jgi:hypothetical protein
MKDFLLYVLMPFRELTSTGRIIGAIATVALNLLMAWDRMSVLPNKKYFFAFNLFAVGYHVSLLENQASKPEQH